MRIPLLILSFTLVACATKRPPENTYLRVTGTAVDIPVEKGAVANAKQP